MALLNTHESYGSVTKFLHWTIFVLLAGMITFGFFLGDIPEQYQATVYNLHKLTGLTILSLMCFRLIWNLFNIKPDLPANTPGWERYAERLVHWLIYLIVIAMPIAGWIGAVAGGRPPKIGDFAITLPIEKSKPVMEQAFILHNTIALLIITIVTIHIGAALYHHFIKKDFVLKRMMPSHHKD